MQQDKDQDQDLCWGKIAAMTEIMEQNAQMTDRQHETINMLSEIVQALSGALQDVQVERLMPHLMRRLDAIQQQQRGTA